MNLNRIIRQFPDIVTRLEAIEKKLGINQPTVDTGKSDSTIPVQAGSGRSLQMGTLTLPKKADGAIKESDGNPVRPRREATGGH